VAVTGGEEGVPATCGAEGAEVSWRDSGALPQATATNALVKITTPATTNERTIRVRLAVNFSFSYKSNV
jgi:hypothetical protein